MSYHTRDSMGVMPRNYRQQNASMCGGCRHQHHSCCCEEIVADGGSRFDIRRNLASAKYGYVLPDPNPVPLPFSLTPLTTDPDQFQLAPVAPNTMPLMQAQFGFDADTKRGALVFISGIVGNNSLNTMYEVTALPATTSQWYVLRRFDIINKYGLRLYDYIQIWNGQSKLVWQITEILTPVDASSPEGVYLEPSNYSELPMYCPLFAKPPSVC